VNREDFGPEPSLPLCEVTVDSQTSYALAMARQMISRPIGTPPALSSIKQA
jgi:hypothetical protein